MREEYRAVQEEDLIGEPIYVYIPKHSNELLDGQYIYVREYSLTGDFANLQHGSYQIHNCPHNDKLLSSERNYREYNMCIDKSSCIESAESNTATTKYLKVEIPLD
ncbi:hypothetical protein_gp147 [Bacillus phage vB_BceM_WH1]|nr:hypothetical protein_gp147 [Bacillus phage vB_BceM_WH1]